MRKGFGRVCQMFILAMPELFGFEVGSYDGEIDGVFLETFDGESEDEDRHESDFGGAEK